MQKFLFLVCEKKLSHLSPVMINLDVWADVQCTHLEWMYLRWNCEVNWKAFRYCSTIRQERQIAAETEWWKIKCNFDVDDVVIPIMRSKPICIVFCIKMTTTEIDRMKFPALPHPSSVKTWCPLWWNFNDTFYLSLLCCFFFTLDAHRVVSRPVFSEWKTKTSTKKKFRFTMTT